MLLYCKCNFALTQFCAQAEIFAMPVGFEKGFGFVEGTINRHENLL